MNKFISLHIPKTGGTVFRRHVLYGSFSKVKMDYKKNHLNEHPINFDVSEYNVIHGHFKASKYLSYNLPYVTWLRDPVIRIVSAYNYNILKRKLEDISFDDFIEKKVNMISSFMDIPREKFVFIGILEKWTEGIKRFEKLVGLDLSSYYREDFLDSIHIHYRKHEDYFQPSPSQIRRIIDLNGKDIEFYNRERRDYAEVINNRSLCE